MITPTLPSYCPDLLHYRRRPTREVRVGNVGVGAANPIRVQSMITADTRDTAACVAEVLALAGAGCEIVRITAQTRVYAENLEHIARQVRAAGCQVPLVADIHFKPDAALEAARWVEKVRVNPGNYADKKKFEIREYSDAQYEEELERIREEFTPLVVLCKDLGRALRIGTNHGSLSDRIMNRYGDTPLGMVESALEFARIARDHNYHDLIFSMKASNPKVMIEAYRLLVARLLAEGPDWNYPIHLGVTEAGDGEDGRIKSAVGIGSLLADGIGDTIRVSLTEDSIHEIPVAQALVAPYNRASSNNDRGVPPQAVAGASRPGLREDRETIAVGWDHLEQRSSSYLPHWRVSGATYAVTFRLKDSIPRSALDDYLRRKQVLEMRLKDLATQSGSRSSLDKLVALRGEIAAFHETHVDRLLNEAHGECHLRRSELASVVVDSLRHFDGDRYQLIAWSIMPNHIHVVLRPNDGHDLADIIHSWKSFAAHRANKLLGGAGAFWQDEYYDHIIRDADDFTHQVRYVLENPRDGSASAEWTGSIYGANWQEVMAGGDAMLRETAAAFAARRQDVGAGRPDDGLGRDAPATVMFQPGDAVVRETAAAFAAQRQDVGAGRPDDGLGRDAPATLGREAPATAGFQPTWDPFSYGKRRSSEMSVMGYRMGGEQAPRVFTTQEQWNALLPQMAAAGDYQPEVILEQVEVLAIDPRDASAIARLNEESSLSLVTVADGIDMEVIAAFRQLAASIPARHPILLKDRLTRDLAGDPLQALRVAATNLGSLLCDGIGDALLVRGADPAESVRLAYNILQATATRIFKADYVACPSCGRTLFNLQATTRKIRASTGHLKGVRIAVMGCIVNGPGEMADADFGYVGGAPNKINLYVGKTPVKFNIAEDEAVERLIDLIRDHGKWVDPPAATPVSQAHG